MLTIHSLTWHSYQNLVGNGNLPGRVRDYLGPEPGWKNRLYWNAQVARADHILTPSEFSRQEIIRFLKIRADRITTTYLGLPRQFRQPSDQKIKSLNFASGLIRTPYLLYVGGFEPHKNVSGLLRMFSLVHKERSDLALVLVGTKSIPQELISQAEQLGLQNGRDVIFLADLGEELNALYDRAGLFLTLSWRESFGLPALEAMSRGIRVLGSMWGAMPEIVGSLGTLVDPRDHRAVAATVLDLLRQPVTPELAACLRARATEFDWSRTADATLEVYHRLIKRKHRNEMSFCDLC